MNCRFCKTALEQVFLDLGIAPLTNSYLERHQLNQSEKKYPLKIFVCRNCKLVQTEDFVENREIFTENYAYFSSVSSSLLEHARRYSKMIIDRLKLDEDSFVLEIASNDGYLLRNFLFARIPCLGIEPATSTADVAEKLGIPVRREFFGEASAKRLAKDGKFADLIVGNNVYAHVPDINDFTAGIKIALKPKGTVTLEFTHLLNIIKNKLFDTMYHEHFSYLSLSTAMLIFQKAGLRIYDVEKISTQGGSLRIYGCHEEDRRATAPEIYDLIDEESQFGLHSNSFYQDFQIEVNQITQNIYDFLWHEKILGKKVVAYGAAAKGNTLLNYAGINTDLISFVCDAAQSKQGKYLPGSHIPILPPSALKEYKPDWVLILPWNLEAEITKQLAYVYDWGGRFLVALPELEILERKSHLKAKSHYKHNEH